MMSTPVRCEKCQKEGRRRLFKFCPEGWFFIETLSDNEEPEKGVTVIMVCSKECGAALWETGPGDLRRTAPYPPETEDPDGLSVYRIVKNTKEGERTSSVHATSEGSAQTKCHIEGDIVSITLLSSGAFVRVVDGPHTGSTGHVNFLDIKGRRALVNLGEGRHGGLTWVGVDSLRGRGKGLWG